MQVVDYDGGEGAVGNTMKRGRSEKKKRRIPIPTTID
jgi:hypothetical protein